MLKRLGRVVWWFGAFLFLFAVYGLTRAAYLGVAAYSTFGVFAWSLAYVLGGSFWRPPTD
ncbi:MAG: hypothetical protein M0Z84_07765 [Gammaproteobacteria bacterium]|nr:hypothetical protein [Gammaproteobacteria bacterium]